MTGRWWGVLALVLPWGAEANDAVPPAAPAVAVSSLPWPDMEGRPVLHVGRVTDLKTLLTVQSVLRDKGKGLSVRLLGVMGGDAWFVADSLPEGGWQALLMTEPRLRLSAPEPTTSATLPMMLGSAVWDTAVQASEGMPADVLPVHAP
jgi:hypothetical protein